MHKVASVQTIAIVAWSAWLATLAVAFILHWSGVLHPWYPPIVVLLALFVAATAFLVVRATCQLIRGPNRRRAIAWLCLEIIPMLSVLSIGETALWLAGTRNFGVGPIWLDGPSQIVAVSLADAELRWRYLCRYEGRHAVMWCTEPWEAGRELDALDRHVERMERVIGQKCQCKVHWVRGPLLGCGSVKRGDDDGLYCRGIALASRLGAAGEDPGALAYVDLHETAHFVIHHLCERSAQAPALLVEGWAESQSRMKPAELAVSAWQRKQRDAALTLAELVSDDWYGRPLGPVYDQGGALVDYLLRTYGGEKFFKLYSTCRRNTIAADCRRILGVTLEELDRDYWQDVERQVAGPEAQRQIQPLRCAQLADGVDPALWEEIVSSHWDAYERARKLFQQARLKVDERRGQSFEHYRELTSDGPHTRTVERVGREGKIVNTNVSVVSAEQSFRLQRQGNGSAWTTAERGPIGKPRFDFVLGRDSTRSPLDIVELSYIADGGWRRLTRRQDCTITSLTPVNESRRTLWRVEFAACSRNEEGWRPVPRRGSFLLAPNQNWAVQEFEYKELMPGQPHDGPQSRVTLRYGPMTNGVPRLEEEREEMLDHRGVVIGNTTTQISDLYFEPTPLEEFTPESFGVRAQELTDPAPTPWLVKAAPAACLIALGLGGTLLWRERRLARGGRTDPVPLASGVTPPASAV